MTPTHVRKAKRLLALGIDVRVEYIEAPFDVRNVRLLSFSAAGTHCRLEWSNGGRDYLSAPVSQVRLLK